MFEPYFFSKLAATSVSSTRLFSNASFYLHPSGDTPRETEKLLTDHGGNIVDSPELANYVISSSSLTSHDKHNVVSNEWVQACIDHNLLLPVEPYLVGKEKLFGSVIFSLGDEFAQTDKEYLFSMMTYYGGCYNESVNESTHYITRVKDKHSLYHDKHKNISPMIKVVSPQWVIDSIKFNKLQPELNYKHTPDPSLLRLILPPYELQDSQNTPNDISSPVLKIITSPIITRDLTNHTTEISYPSITHDSGSEYTPTKSFSQLSQDSVSSMSISPHLSHNSHLAPPSFTKPPDMFTEKLLASPSIIITPNTPEPAPDVQSESVPTSNPSLTQAHTHQSASKEKLGLFHKAILFFDGFIELIGRDAQKEWEKIVMLNGGYISPIYNDRVTHVILRHVMCDAYTRALRDRKLIASAYWLNDVLLKEQLFPPCCPLHIPIKNPKPKEMAGLMISVSNFEGAERSTLKDMTSLLGANYTSYLSKKHDFLITNKAQGIKYTKAKEWNIPVVTSRYLVDALLQPGLPDRIKTLYRNFDAGNRLEINNIDYLKPLLSAWTHSSS